MTFGSLFTGIGGFDLGFERAGWECRWQVEIDVKCRGVLRRHFAGHQLQHGTDVRTVNTADFVQPDLICGGFPCQDLSVAGRRAGLAGERSGLFYEFMRVVRELAPRWVLVENVPGLLSSSGGRDMGAALGSLEELGYGAAYRVLDAQWFGVAQRRRRVFIVGCLGDWRRAAEVLFEPESRPWDSPPSREEAANVAGTLTAIAGRRGAGVEDNMIPVARCISTRKGHRLGDAQDTLIPFDTTHLTSRTNRSNPQPGAPLHTMASGAHTPAIAFRTTGNRGCYETGDRIGALNTGTDPSQQVIAYQCHGSNVGPMGALRCGNGNETGGVPFLPTRWGVRRLTPLEQERCMGFPDGWTRVDEAGAALSDTARTRMLGNAVVPQVAEWLARRVLAGEGEE